MCDSGLCGAVGSPGLRCARHKADDDGEYEIEKILGHRRKRNGDYTYLVKWKGFSYEESTWEPQSNFKSHTLKAYHVMSQYLYTRVHGQVLYDQLLSGR